LEKKRQNEEAQERVFFFGELRSPFWRVWDGEFPAMARALCKVEWPGLASQRHTFETQQRMN
jgi:hypothetical protein